MHGVRVSVSVCTRGEDRTRKRKERSRAVRGPFVKVLLRNSPGIDRRIHGKRIQFKYPFDTLKPILKFSLTFKRMLIKVRIINESNLLHSNKKIKMIL